MKRGQVSLEIIYSVATMIIIFLIILSINFNRRMEVTDLEEYAGKLDECQGLANRLNGVYTLGNGTTAEFYTRAFTFHITKVEQAIIVTDEVVDSSTVDASCTFLAPIEEDTTLSKLTSYNITNSNNLIVLIQI